MRFVTIDPWLSVANANRAADYCVRAFGAVEVERLEGEPGALDAGAASMEAVWDTPYGDRRGMVRDPWGNVWQVATHRHR